jgi:hypothetical protein
MPKRLTALVIGNAAYTQTNKLSNPANDATDVSAKLGARGFTVIEKTDCTHKEMDHALKEFRASLTDSDVALFFFAGHGMQIDGENYLAAVDADFGNETDAKHSSLSLNRLIETMEKSGTATKIIFLDACRNNPFEFAWHRSAATRGLASVYAPRGTIIAFATSPGQIALDGTGRNGRYTAALLKHIDRPDCSLENMFKRVRNTLSAATKDKQISWRIDSADLLPARAGCLMKMLPVKVDDRPQNRETTKFGDQTRINPGDRGALSCCRAPRQEEDPRRVHRGDGVSSKTCHSNFAALGGDRSTETCHPTAAPIRRSSRTGIDDSLGGRRPHLWEALKVCNPGPIGCDGAPRSSPAESGGSAAGSHGKRGDDRQGTGFDQADR